VSRGRYRAGVDLSTGQLVAIVTTVVIAVLVAVIWFLVMIMADDNS
jgi:hypothetical protein